MKMTVVLVLRQTARSERIHANQSLQKKMVPFINVLGKGLTQEINGDAWSLHLTGSQV